MTKRTGSLNATLGFAGVWALSSLACGPQKVAPDIGVHLPVAEQEIFVEVPGRTGMTADALRHSYYKGRRTISHVRPRCVTAPSKDGSCAIMTDVRITAVEGAKFVDDQKPPDKPQLIAWIENLGTSTTFDGIEPMAQARYALVVDTQPAKNPNILLVAFPGEIAVKGSGARATGYGRVFKCHNYGLRLISDADYQPCNSHYGVAASSRLRFFASPTIVTSMASWGLMTAGSDPTWFSCASGCCTSAMTIAAY